MTERKPPGVDFETFVDRQIREAEARGEFQDLPGRGKPLPSDDAPYDEMWWVKRKMHREGVSYLPASLVLRKEVEDALAQARSAPTEKKARQLVEGANEKIERAMRTPMEGPAHKLVPIDVAEFLEQWREGRRERGRAASGAATGTGAATESRPAASREETRGRRTPWWWRGRR